MANTVGNRMNHTLCTLTIDAETLNMHLNDTSGSSRQESIVESYECPGTSFPATFLKCCPEGLQPLCCPVEQFQIIESFGMVWIPIMVILLCILASVIVVVCCFWSKCPLYTTCKSRHFTSESVAYRIDEEDEEVLNGPVDEKKGAKSYTLDDVKMKSIIDV
ncbi:uncharacterized protein LOC136034910 isoform X2 [Artemia franciscana]|uniref:Uncharacterized protein n=1 Tax=Artemia franciscana TaxID=6661 RepID=A0AA88LIH7_ARTSF|nr:hypothetical protein QYM36_003288 [Artemia franciscana]